MAKTERLKKGKRVSTQVKIAEMKKKYGPAVNLIHDVDRKEGSLAIYRPDHNRMVFWMALAGLNEYEMASVIGIADVTLSVWKKTRPDFMAALQAGKMEAVATSAHSLFRVANGYERKEERIIPNRVKEYDPDTGRVLKEYTKVLRVSVNKYYPPNVQALLRFLAAKYPEVWSDRSEVNNNTRVEHTIDTTKLSKKKLKLLQSIAKSGVKMDQKKSKEQEKQDKTRINLSRKQKKKENKVEIQDVEEI
jgi:hypothetical protein